jgi:uncharacterized damage-inducible protein DinB
MSVFSNPAGRSLEHATAYTAAVLELVGSTDPIRILHDTPSALSRGIDGLDSDQLSGPETAGKWSIVQVLQHLADSELVWGYRLRMVLAHDRPAITGYDQDLWATRLRYEDADPHQAIQEFNVLRQANLRLLARASAGDLARVVLHAERGEESVAQMIRLYAGHDLLHLSQIARIRKTISAGTGA